VNRIQPHSAHAGQYRGAANRHKEALEGSGAPVDSDSLVLTGVLLVACDVAGVCVTRYGDSRSVAVQRTMGSFIALVAWLLLLVLCWPIALLALVLWPVVWLISLPFRLLGIAFDAVFAFLSAVLFLPARVLGYRGR